MNDFLKENHEKVFRMENKEDIVCFIKTVETGNLHEIQTMISNEMAAVYELESIMLKLKIAMIKDGGNYNDSSLINGNIDEIMGILQKIKNKLYAIDKVNGEHWETLEYLFSDSKIIHQILECNKGLI
jgi:hypothetical protein